MCLYCVFPDQAITIGKDNEGWRGEDASNSDVQDFRSAGLAVQVEVCYLYFLFSMYINLHRGYRSSNIISYITIVGSVQ